MSKRDLLQGQKRPTTCRLLRARTAQDEESEEDADDVGVEAALDVRRFDWRLSHVHLCAERVRRDLI